MAPRHSKFVPKLVSSDSVNAGRRRTLFLIPAFGVTAMVGSRFAFANGKATEDPASEPVTSTCRVRVVTELKGDVHFKNLSEPKNRAPRSVPIESKSTLDFVEESRFDSALGVLTSVRHFQEAVSENRLNKQPVEVGLRAEAATILYRQDRDGILINSPFHPITPLEKDLVQGAICPAAMDLLLPKQPIKVGSAWALNGEDAQILFQLDSVQSCDVTVKLVSADEKKGQMEIRGRIVGAARGNATSLQLEGKCQVDRPTARVSWLAVTIDEERAVGLVEPGFAITARLRVLREPTEQLSPNRSLATVEAHFPNIDSLRLMEFRSDAGGFRFLADQSWNIIAENKLETVLRLIQDRAVVAQCNISNLEATEPGVQLTLEGYQAEIQRTLGVAFQQFVEANERVTEAGLRMIRIVSAGEVEQIPIQWINIHLSNDEGRHVALVFSMDATKADVFGSSDLQIAGAFELLEILAPNDSVDQSQPVENAVEGSESNRPQISQSKASSTSKQ